MTLKKLLKKALPPGFLSAYHWLLARGAALAYGCPSERLIIVGVTGTNGKTTVANMIAAVLSGAGEGVALATTANFRIGEREWLNDAKMTMLGRFRLQRFLRRAVRAGCRYAVIETSSEGIKQHRQSGINYDLAVFTNLTPEHLTAHGGFDRYRDAKGKLFRQLGRGRIKRFGGRPQPKIGLINLKDRHAGFFLGFAGFRRWGWSAGEAEVLSEIPLDESLQAEEIRLSADGSGFSICGVRFRLPVPGDFNVENAVAAAAAGLALGISLERSATILADFAGVPGRLEPIDEGQPFSVLVDYAPEPESLGRLYGAIALMKIPGRIIHVLGSCGGGRDRSRRPVLGRMAGERAAVVIVTDEDPYDESPEAIIDEVAEGAKAAGKAEGLDLFLIQDRREAIRQAISLARPGDLVLLTGKGSEQFICRADGRKQPWDDRVEARRALKEISGPGH